MANDINDKHITTDIIHNVHRWTRDGMPLPITDDNFADMESIKVKI